MMREKALFILKEISVYLISATALILPFFFLPATTDTIELPKQTLLSGASLILLLLFCVRTVIEGKASFRRTPFDIALLMIFVVVILSALFSQSRFVSLIGSVPLLSILLFTFISINTITSQKEERKVVIGLLISGGILAILTILNLLRIYVLPYSFTQNPGFSLSGSLLSATLYLFALIPASAFFLRSYFRKPQGQETPSEQEEILSAFFLGITVLIVIGAVVGFYQLATSARPLVLPQQTGLATAVRPLGDNFQTALFGSGPGTYLFNFTRFKDVALNRSDLWNLRFGSASSFFLELLSTLGVIGAISFLFLLARLLVSFFKSGTHQGETLGVFLSSLLLFVFSFFFPFSFVLIFLLFLLLAIYIARLAIEHKAHVFDVTVSLVALRKGLLTLTPSQNEGLGGRITTELLPVILLSLSLLFTGIATYWIGRFFISDITFGRALVAANQNLARETYDLQNQSIQTFPNRDTYHRIFSQTNLALAISLAGQLRTATPSATSDQDRQNLITLVQQAINFGRNAATLAPLNVANWENLTNVYRAIIGFAQDADRFAVNSAQQAIALEPTNPLLYISLGGIYSQLGQQDLAIEQFRIAVGLKNDLANAHYNLGTALEGKGDAVSLGNALVSYQNVRSLVPTGSEDFKRIEEQIAALQRKLGTGSELPTPSGQLRPSTPQESLKLSTPAATLPEQRPPVEVKGPPPPATESTESGERR